MTWRQLGAVALAAGVALLAGDPVLCLMAGALVLGLVALEGWRRS